MRNYMFEFAHPSDGCLTLTRHDGTVVLSCHWPFDLETDEWIDIMNTFSFEDYAKAIDAALLSGEGSVGGVEGGFLKISHHNDAFVLEFSNAQSGWAAKSLRLSIDRPLQELTLSAG